MNSMTGFGRGEYSDSNHHITVEIKTVNSRYGELNLRMPRSFNALEDKVRKEIGKVVLRGKADVYINALSFGETGKVVRVDKGLALAYHKAISEMALLLDNDGPTGALALQIARLPDVLKVEEMPDNPDILWQKLRSALDQALSQLGAMRQVEGQYLAIDLGGRLEQMRQNLLQVQQRSPQVEEEYRQRLLDKMQDALKAVGAQLDETRVILEAAIFAERTAISEEIIRLHSHLQQFEQALKATEPMGRRLDFLVQEMNREVNTIGSKANDLELTNLVVNMKSEMEKIREQIQNIE